MFKMKVTRMEVETVLGSLIQIFNNPAAREADFGEIIFKNVRIIQLEFTAIEEGKKKKLADFEKERMALCEKYADKSKGGNPISLPNSPDGKQGGFKITKDRDLFDGEICDLKKKYEKVFADLETYLKSEIQISVHPLNLAQIKKEKISGPEMVGVYSLIQM